MSELRATVLVPSYDRPDDLVRCLAGLHAQERPADEIVVVLRPDDDASHAAVVSAGRVGGIEPRVVPVHEPGQVAALNAGLDAATGDVVAIIDDDTVPRPGWLACIVASFARDATVGGVGGRDRVHAVPPRPEHDARVTAIGQVTRRGRLVGGHHLRSDDVHDVAFLKGANMAVRRAAIGARRFETTLRGGGAQPHNDLEFTLGLHAAGWRLVWDPDATVDHYVTTKETARRRGSRTAADAYDCAYNEALAVTRYVRGGRAVAYLVDRTLFGDTFSPGLVWALRRGRHEADGPLRLFVAALRGRRAGRRAARSDPGRAAPAAPDGARPRVAVVAHDVGPVGGMERATEQLVLRSADPVDVVVVAATCSDAARARTARWVRVRVPRRPFLLRFVAFWIVGGWKVARLRLPTQTCGAIVPNRARAATVHFCHVGYVEASPGGRSGASGGRQLHHRLVQRASILAERWCYRPSRTGVLLAVSDVTRDEVARHFPDCRVVATPYGIDTERFRPDPDARARVRTGLGVAASTVAVIFVGGDWPRKGVPELAEAVAKLAVDGDDVELWIVGEGDRRAIERVFPPEQRARLRFLGWRDDVHELYAAADICASPSAYETFSLAPCEAAACELPVVATAVGAMPALAAGGGAVLVAQETGEIADALRPLVHEPARRSEMGAAGRAVVSGWSWQRFADATMHEVLAEPRT